MRVGLISNLFGFLVMTMTALSGWSQPKVGDVLPLWSEGYLDIHHINTGKGEAVFSILPDGTTMLTDAGATGRPKPRVTDPKPDGSRTPGEWISRYIMHFMENQPEKKLDYVLLTHFHDDHMGELSSGSKTSGKGNYILTGITEVGEHIPFAKIVDRNWPDYNWPVPLKADHIQNYIRFIKWQEENRNMKPEQFRVGANDQFTLVRQPEKYPEFEIRNLAANGRVWTGVATNTRNHFPAMENLKPEEYPGENKLSCAIRMSYGKFDYFNGGDLTTGAPGTWQDIETPVGLVTGPVEVCEANHHAYYDAMGAPFLQAVRPKVMIVQIWSPGQPDNRVLSWMMSQGTYPGPRDVFTTNLMEETRVVSGRTDQLKSRQGHIVIRVNPGGENYMIYILDDSQENFRIKAIHGPYTCD
ncbi:MAG: MBL fold metallo-hydrolase [Mangrovibacterium sp.]|nr:MBL fold metallo-hydrolase [Mangrovibacterium sp.]